MTEYAVHGGEGECHPTGRAQELTAVHAQVASTPLGTRNDFPLQQALLRSLGDGQVFLVGDNLGGHWQMAIEPRVEIRFTDPSIVDWGSSRTERSLDWAYSTTGTTEFLSAKDYCATTRFTTAYAPICPGWPLVNLTVASVEQIVAKTRTPKFRCQADQYSLCSKIRPQQFFVGGPTNEDYPEKARKKRERSYGLNRDFHSAHFWRN